MNCAGKYNASILGTLRFLLLAEASIMISSHALHCIRKIVLCSENNLATSFPTFTSNMV